MAGTGDGMNELALVLHERMKEAGKGDKVVDFGTMGKNGFLTPDILQMALRSDDYLTLKHVGNLVEGDRVLVIWVNSEPVIVGKL